MLRITLAQMRRSLGRLSAAGLAIVIGTAFVAATLLAGNLITRATYDSIAARYAGADLVVQDDDYRIDDAGLDGIAQVDGVRAVDPLATTYLQLEDGGRTIWQSALGTASDPALTPLEVTDGALPDADGQIALPVDVADRLGAGVGDEITVQRDVFSDADTWEVTPEQMTVVGLVEDPAGAYAMSGGQAVLDADVLREWSAESMPPGAPITYGEALVALDDGTDVAAAQAALGAALGGSGPQVVTPDEHAEAAAAELTGGQDLMFLVFVLTFAAIALVVAGLVIANTFQVLVAQRTRTLALLRCVGADKGQVGRSVVLEATILGAVASLAGVLVGVGLGQVALWVANAQDLAVALPASVAVTWQVVVVPVVAGTLVTMLAALVPARVATRVAPLAALRPADAPSTSRRAGKVRLVGSLLATVLGFGLLALGAALGTLADEPTFGLLAGIAGGALSFVGVAVGAVFWLPKVTAAAGRLVGSSGPTARLASANTLRNPRRTAATSTALLIGVTLVAMMSTGAASARVSLTSALDSRYPVDVELTTQATGDDGSPAALPTGLADQVAGVADVAGVAEVSTANASTPDVRVDADGYIAPADGGASSSDGEPLDVLLAGVDPADATGATQPLGLLSELAPGTIMLNQPQGWGLSDGDTLQVDGPDGELALTVATVDAALPYDAVLADSDLATLDASAVTSSLWVGLDDPAAAGDAVPAIQDIVSDTGEAVGVSGAAVERSSFEDVIDAMLGIVLGLLAVAVVIALIGVANTLSLSVIERRKESATLRAIGLSKTQLRGMLAIEGLLIAGVGAVLGIVLGLLYGWAGSAAALGVMGDVVLTVPWREVVLVLVVAALAGLIASVAPSRTALKASPVEALATE